MKRFSPKQTLSNFATRVRETVEFMNTKSTAMRGTSLCALVIALVFAGTGQSSAGPDDQNKLAEMLMGRTNSGIDLENAKKKYCTLGSPDYDKGSCESATKGLNKALSGGSDSDEKRERLCERVDREIEDASKDAQKSCQSARLGNDFSKCLTKVMECAKEESSGFDEEDEETTCDAALANKCPAIPAFNSDRNYTEEYQDAERERKDLKKDLDSLLDEQKEAQKELARKQREMQETQQNDALAQREQERKIKEQLDEALESIGKAQKKGFEAAQAQYEELELQVLALQTEAANANLAVSNIEAQLQSKCRASAERAYSKAEAERLAALAKTNKKKNVGGSTAVSGTSKREKAATGRARALDFNAFMSECTSGVSSEGMNLLNEIAQAKAKKKIDDGVAAKKAEMLEKRRASVAQRLMAMEEEADGEAKKIIKKVNDEMAALNEKRDLIAQQNQARMIEFQQEQAASKQSLDQKIQYANAELGKTVQKAAFAEKRKSCIGNNANRSESTREKISDGYGSSANNIYEIETLCRRRAGYKVCGDEVPYACIQAARANATTPRGGKTPSLNTRSGAGPSAQ